MESIVLAIVGSRFMTDESLLEETLKRFVADYGMPKRIVSGGAKGADTLGEKWGT